MGQRCAANGLLGKISSKAAWFCQGNGRQADAVYRNAVALPPTPGQRWRLDLKAGGASRGLNGNDGARGLNKSGEHKARVQR